jgi:hypothetical protein
MPKGSNDSAKGGQELPTPELNNRWTHEAE